MTGSTSFISACRGVGPAACALLVAFLLTAGCERPFVEVEGPEIEILAPDPGVVLVTPAVTVEVSASSFRAIDSVFVNGQPMVRVEGESRWTADISLEAGLSELVVTAFDIQDAMTQDTVRLVHMPFLFQLPPNGPTLPEGRGGHAAVLLNSGRILVTGGAARVGEIATNDAFLGFPTSGEFEQSSSSLVQARTGHSAIRLPDGRVLIAGGSRKDSPTEILQLVETVEIYNPVTGVFAEVPFEGDPIRRTEHTAILRRVEGIALIDLYGGRGDIQYRPSPRFGVRQDLRTFAFRNDSLIALSPGPGALLDDALFGHSQTALSDRSDNARYLIHGTHFGDQFSDQAALILDYSNPLGLIPELVQPAAVPRTLHASNTLEPGFVASFGGRQATPSEVLDSSELFVEAAKRFLDIPSSASKMQISRFAHTATKVDPSRIIIIGGFQGNGNSTPLSEYFIFDLAGDQ